MKRLPALLMLAGGFAIGAAAVAVVGLADRSGAIPEVTGGAAAPQAMPSRPPIRHVLPGMELLGKTDHSRLDSRPVGTVAQVIETEDGKVVILDSGDAPVYESDAAGGSTVLVKDFVVPSITPRQAFEQPDELVVLGREPAKAPDAPALSGTGTPPEKL